jgi:hypothetical protein
MNKKEMLVLLLIVIAMATRFIFIVDGQSILPNFTAVGAIALISATHMKGLRKWIIPICVLWLSDIILNNVIYAQYYDSFQIFGSLWVYASLLVIGLVGYKVLKQINWRSIGVASILGAVLFFLITNFGVWASATSPYAKDLSGLMTCYAAGIPFFRNTLLSNLFFGYALYGAYEFIAYRVKDIEPVVRQHIRS